MGFLNGLGRLLQGKEVFQNEGAQPSLASSDSTSNTQSKQSQFVDERGYKIIPHVTLDRVKWNRSGDTMTITAWVTNHSKWPVRIDHFTVLGQKQVFQQELGPNDRDQLVIHKGTVASSEHDSHAELTFLLKENGDLFKNVYHVEFNRESDGKFVIEELHDDGPVRDI